MSIAHGGACTNGTWRRPSATVQVERLGYARAGHDSLHPLDAVLNLPPARYSLYEARRGSRASRPRRGRLSCSPSTGQVALAVPLAEAPWAADEEEPHPAAMAGAIASGAKSTVCHGGRVSPGSQHQLVPAELYRPDRTTVGQRSRIRPEQASEACCRVHRIDGPVERETVAADALRFMVQRKRIAPCQNSDAA